MKTVFIFPPVWSKKAPSSGITSISGYLKENGYQTKIFDLNNEFYFENLTDEKYNQAYNFVQTILSKKDLTETEIEIIKYYKENKKIINFMKNKINYSVHTMQSENFYNKKKFKIAAFIIGHAIEFISLQHFPFIIIDEKIENRKKEYNYEDYKTEATNPKNMFFCFMDEKASKIVNENPQYIGISINFEGQMLAGLTLAYILKKKYNKQVILGGTHITRSIENIKNDSSLFDNFADFVIINNGEIPFLKLLQQAEKKCKLEDIPNLIYKVGNEIKINKLSYEKPDIEFPQDFDHTIKNKYFLPETVFPLSISQGCYWGQCKFCDFRMVQYTQRNIEAVINEIKILKEKYNAKFFFLTDSALSPQIAKLFAKRLIEEKINIKWATFLRFEEAFDKKLLFYLYKSGLRLVAWGLESASQKILNTMNKGININTAKRILKDAYNIGIINRISVLYLFPSETYSDFCETINFLEKNKKYIFHISFHRYILKKYSYIFEHMDEFNIHLTTDATKFEYHIYELGLQYNEEDYINRINQIKRNRHISYITSEETLLYASYKQNFFSNILRKITY
ncbi:MAG: B12-binding domain-containing radical SAM protein [Candidatus Gastranaerophilales bacterium]|nr:B12-binding domain-containing radical SAM protein [Candidatus Gastranaerophilales bacterium]